MDPMSVADWNAQTIAEFRANHGRVGGQFEGAPLLLLHTIGARSGASRVNPMMYLPDGDRYLVFASKAGSDRNPDWYYNLLAHPEARIEVGEQTLTVHAEELHGPGTRRFLRRAGPPLPRLRRLPALDRPDHPRHRADPDRRVRRASPSPTLLSSWKAFP